VLKADFRRYFRVLILLEKNKIIKNELTTYHTDEMEAPRCGEEGFLLTEQDK